MDLTKLKKTIAASAKKVNTFKEERTALNEEIGSIRQDLVTKGIPKAAFDAALRYANWDEDKRKGFDAAYALVREALNLPFEEQGELFIPGEDEAETEVEAEATHGASPMFQ